MSGWIKSDQELPEDGIEVVAFLTEEGKENCECSYIIAMNNYCDGEGLWMTAQGWLKDEWVSHWMPLPEPPK